MTFLTSKLIKKTNLISKLTVCFLSLVVSIALCTCSFAGDILRLQIKGQSSGIIDIRLNKETIEMLSIDSEDLAIHQEHLRGLINHHFEETGSLRAQQILEDFDLFAPKFTLIKPKSSDVKTLLGHRSRSTAELRVLTN